MSGAAHPAGPVGPNDPSWGGVWEGHPAEVQQGAGDEPEISLAEPGLIRLPSPQEVLLDPPEARQIPGISPLP